MPSSRFPPLPSVRDLIKLYKLRALKQLSQNFLLDPRVCGRIVKAAGRIRDCDVCEVGPGPGSITRSILEKSPAKVIVIEKDSRFLPALEMLEDSSDVPMEIIRGDVMNFNMEKIFSEDKVHPWVDSPPDVHIIGNLPFNVSTPLIIRWLHAISERRSAWRYGRVRMTLTFQKEVAERIVSPILTKSRCRLSIMCQNWCYVEHKLTIKGSAFIPPPEVDVGVVTFEPMVKPVIDLPFHLVEKVARSLFHFRQKLCIRGIGTLYPTDEREQLTAETLSLAGLDPRSRPIMFTVGEIGRIAFAYSDIISKRPDIAKYEYRAGKNQEYYEETQGEEDEDNTTDSSDRTLSASG